MHVENVNDVITEFDVRETSSLSRDFSSKTELRAHFEWRVQGGTGAYSHSKGISMFREDIAKFIAARDGYPCDPEHVFMCAGASSGIEKVMSAAISSPKDAILVPIPQYPLYSALVTLLGGTMVGYHLDESKNWGFDLEVRIPAPKRGLRPLALFCDERVASVVSGPQRLSL